MAVRPGSLRCLDLRREREVGYGLGKVGGFPQFASQLVGWTFPQETTPGMEATFKLMSGTAPGMQDVEARVELRDITGAPRNFLDTALTITDTSGLSRTVALTQYSPGIYGATVSGLTEGVYSLHVAQASSDTKEPVSALSTGLVVPYPGEFRLPDPDDVAGSALLTDLAQIGGGTELTITQPAAAFTHDITAQPQRVQLWPWLLLAAIILFPIDIAIRRLSISWTQVRRVLRPARPPA